MIKGHLYDIEAFSWQWGSVSDESRKGNALCMSDAYMSKAVDGSSADLMNHHAMGTVFPTVVVTIETGGPPTGPSYRYEFSDAVISSFSISSGFDSSESFGLTYSGVMGTLITLDPLTELPVETDFDVGPNACK